MANTYVRALVAVRFGDPLVAPAICESTRVRVPICEGCGCMQANMDEAETCSECGFMDETLSPEDVALSKGEKKVDDKDPLAMKDPMGRVVGKWQGKTEPASSAKKTSVPPRQDESDGMRHPAWQPPTSPGKTWIDPTTGETRGYCSTCQGRGKVSNSKGRFMVCPGCKGKRIVTRQPKVDEADLVQKAPPGRERQVKALKKNKDIDNPWAVAWASYNKSH